MNIKALLLKQVSLYPKKGAIIFKDNSISFSQVKDVSFRLANHLTGLGINQSDKIAVFLPNTPEAVDSFIACFSIGAVLVPLDFMLTEEEVIHFVNHSEAKVFIAQVKKEVGLENVRKNCPMLKEIIVCGENLEGQLCWEDVLAKSSSDEPDIDIDESRMSSIFYTSGSTGRPKGVMLTYKNFDSPIKCINHYLRLSVDDIILCGGLPFSHLGGLDYILLMLYFGQTLVLMERFLPLEFLKNVEKYKVSLFWIVPAMYIAVLSLKEYDKFDLSSLRYAVVFGAPSSSVLLKRFQKVCPNTRLINGWGMTETSAPNCFLPPDTDKIESIGKFPPGMEAIIVDDTGRGVEIGKEGELWVRGEGVMKGYYKELGLTEEVLTHDRWLKTGDIAKKDTSGFYYIVGRKKDMIKVAGEVVFSSEVEEKILCHPKIKEAAVIGVGDKLRGEAPKAFIVVKEENNLHPGELKNYLRKHLAHFKIPHHFEVVKELPKNRAGKIDKLKLKQDSLSVKRIGD